MPAEILVYLNRLSDLLFTLARLANHRAGSAGPHLVTRRSRSATPSASIRSTSRPASSARLAALVAGISAAAGSR